jgi:hypothetical protein
MNKKSKRRAFFVYVIICLSYVVVGFGLPERVSMTRISDEQLTPSKSVVLSLPNSTAIEQVLPPEGAPSWTTVPETATETAEDVKAPVASNATTPSANAQSPDTQSVAGGKSGIEPSLLISIPIVCYAIKAGWVEKESLIFGKKDAYNNVGWRKPIEILKDRDEQGIKNILNTIGEKRMFEFMKREGFVLKAGLSAEDVILGRGYTVKREQLVAFYDRYASNTCDELFPFSVRQAGIAKGPSGFRLTSGKETGKDGSRAPEEEWMMPNLANLPIRSAIEKLSTHTSHIKINGSGIVMNQFPRAFERLKGEPECVILGRTQFE